LVRLSPAHRFGLVLAVVCLLAVNSPTIYKASTDFVRPPPVMVTLCAPSNTSPVKADGAQLEISNDEGVPDYNVTVFLEAENTYSGGPEVLHLSVVDNGLFHLQKPYLYILAFDPSGNLAFVFPCGYTSSETYFNGYSSPLLSGTTSEGKWQDQSSFGGTVNGVPESCTTQDQVFLPSGTCVSRTSLLAGQTSQGDPIEFTFPASSPGLWSVYAFVFDTTYLTRANITYCVPYSYGETCTPSFEANSVGATRADFESNSYPAPIVSLDYPTQIQLITSAVLAGLSYFFLGSEKVYPRIDRQWKLHSSSVKRLVILLVIVAVFDWLILVLLRG
jgi:hypothetical protein